MRSDPSRKLNLSDPGHDAAGDELEQLIKDGESEKDVAVDDTGHDSFLERFPTSALRERRKPN